MVKKIILANPRGFCAGVDRAIEVVEKSLKIYGKPIYVKHQIVHNDHVVKSLEEIGAIFIEDLDEVPENSMLIFSAHGVSPKIKIEAEKRNLKVIDATCPLVTKVHLQAKRYNKEGYSIILIGHKNHPETVGTMGEASMILVENVKDVENLEIENPKKVAYITQTTLSLDDTKEIIEKIKEKFPLAISSSKGEICYATQNRQNAVKELAKKTDLILVVGSEKSSNSIRLVETAIKYGVNSYLIQDKNKIKKEWLNESETIGITSGASTPEILVKEVLEYIKDNFNETIIENIDHIKEDVNFILPKEIRNI